MKDDLISLGEMLSAADKFSKGEELSPRERAAVVAYLEWAKNLLSKAS